MHRAAPTLLAVLLVAGCSYSQSDGLVARPPVSGQEGQVTATTVLTEDGEEDVGPGDLGAAVSRWQIRLDDWLALATTSPRIPLSGSFDSVTEQSTRQFETAAGLTVDGRVDASDRSAMTSLLAELEGQAEPLQNGTNGRLAEFWQASLNEFFALVDPSVKALTVDGQFGPGTERTQRQFEERSGLVVDGTVTAEDRAALREALLDLRGEPEQVLVATGVSDLDLDAFELFAFRQGEEVCLRAVTDAADLQDCVTLGDDPIEFRTLAPTEGARVAAGVARADVATVRVVSLDDSIDLTPVDVGGVAVFGGRLPEASLDRVEALDAAGAVLGTAAG